MEHHSALARPSINDVVLVTWRDIIATSGWEEEPDIPQFVNVGWLVSMDEDKLVIANCRNSDREYAAFHCFPRGVVVAVSVIQRNATE